jgi:hypothetical protein
MTLTGPIVATRAFIQVPQNLSRACRGIRVSLFGSNLGAKNFRLAAFLLAFGLLTACKTSQEATNAATQLTSTSQQLSAYYTDLSNQVADTITLNEMHSQLMFQTAMDSSVRAELDTTQKELAKRVALAQSLGKLATAYAGLANSKAATDISTAASGLATQCKSIAPLPGGNAIPDVVSVASQNLVEYIRQRKLRKSSESISQIMSGIQSMFASEMPAYKSLNRRRVEIAQRVANEFLQKDVVELSPALAPALKPFNLSAKLQPNQMTAEMRAMAKVDIQRTGELQIDEFAEKTNSLSAALKAAGDQVKLVAGKKH